MSQMGVFTKRIFACFARSILLYPDSQNNGPAHGLGCNTPLPDPAYACTATHATSNNDRTASCCVGNGTSQRSFRWLNRISLKLPMGQVQWQTLLHLAVRRSIADQWPIYLWIQNCVWDLGLGHFIMFQTAWQLLNNFAQSRQEYFFQFSRG